MNLLKNIFCTNSNTILDILQIFENAPKYNLPSGIALFVDENFKLVGVITEGDVRRALLNGNKSEDFAIKFMTSTPIVFNQENSITEIFEKLPIELKKRNRKSIKYLGKVVLINDYNQPVRVIDYHELWEQKVATHRNIVVVGMGYVGLTLALVLADSGFKVVGIEADSEKVNLLNLGESYIHEIGLPELLKEHLGKNLSFKNELPNDGDVFIIAVGTPIEFNINNEPEPNTEFLINSCTSIASKLKRGNLVILRSTVPIGTTRDLVKNLLEKLSGLICGIDFHLAFAPERTAEGRAIKELRSLPQIIGGFNNDSVRSTEAIFRDITPTIVKVDSLEAAEMAKLINNTFRDYVFAFANQAAQVAYNYNIDVFKVIKAANEGYIRDPVPLPSPGVGGPCLTKDPHIFASISDKHPISNGFFRNSRRINESMHPFIYENVLNATKLVNKDINTCNILFCGLAFKGHPETGDLRNSTSIDIANLFQGKVKNLYGYDPVASSSEIEKYNIIPFDIRNGFKNIDILLFLNNHKSFEKINVFEMVSLMNENPIIFDGWDTFYHEDIISIRPSVYLGLSYISESISKA